MFRKIILYGSEAGFGGLLWIVLDRELSTEAAVMGMLFFALCILLLNKNVFHRFIDDEKAHKDWEKEWKDMARRFQEVGNDRIRAEWYSETHGWHGELVGEQWMFREEHKSKDSEVLCRMAGAMLLTSPGVAKSLTPKVRTRSDDGWRWLYYLMDQKGAAQKSSTGSSTYRFSKMNTECRDICDLAGASACACLECSVLELKQQ